MLFYYPIFFVLSGEYQSTFIPDPVDNFPKFDTYESGKLAFLQSYN